MTSPATFELFKHLSSELRIKIWQLAFPEPRIVPIRYSRILNQYTTNSVPPSLLHICSESRVLFLQTYTKLILSPKYDSCVFIDFARDTIFFDSLDCSPEGDLAFDLKRSPHKDRIERCAIEAQVWEVLRVFRYEGLSEMKWMGGLKTVALVLEREGPRRRVLGWEGREEGEQMGVVVGDGDTVSSEIRHVLWYVESLRWEIENEGEAYWGALKPNVQMWLW